MNNNERFLGLYKRLDSILDGIYDTRTIDSAVFSRESDLKKSDILSKRQRGEKYSLIRQMRNMLAHGEIDLDNPFMVNDQVIEFLEEEIELLEHEKKAIDVAVPFDSILYAIEGSNVRSIAKKMTEKGITNVPILSSKKVIGIFNGHALMQIISKYADTRIDEYTKIKDIMEFTGLKAHPGIRYEFVSKDTNADDLEAIFKRTSKGKTELILVTDHGHIDEPLLGVISPHDILES